MRPSLLAALGCLALAAAVLADEPGLPGFQQVDPGIYRGKQPDDEGFATLAHMGVKTVIDMRGGWIHMPREKKLVEAAGMRYVEEEFSGIFAPRDPQIAKLLAVMEDPAAAPVFMHCRRGADRVGTLVACYRIAHDHWTNQRAFDEACSIGLSPFEPFMRAYIRHFDPARLSSPAAPAAAKPSSLPMMFDFVLGNQLP